MMQIYYINLARRTDRRAFMEEQFARLGLTATRIEAVTPADLSDADRQRPISPLTGFALPEPALCCTFSHLRALGEMLNTGVSWALILEDDAVLSASLPSFLREFEASPPDTLIVRIEAATKAHLTLSRQIATVAGVTLHRFMGWDIGAAGYIVSDAGGRIVRAEPDIKMHDIDVAMFHDIIPLSRRLRPLQTSEGLCIQAGYLANHSASLAESDLRGSRRMVRLPPWSSLAKVFDRDVIQASRKAWLRFVLGGTRMRVPFKAD
jgi:GR25 family glycosyltransferase involved in LPS biosynthesis